MTEPAKHRGGAPVGYLSDLDAVEAAAVLYLRLWSDGPDRQAQMWADLSRVLGPDAGRQALQAFEQICTLCAHHGRRPLMRHSLRCRCLGADECCFANFIAAASDGELEDAMLIATMIVRADVAPGLVGLAETFGLALKRVALRDPSGPPDRPSSKTLH